MTITTIEWCDITWNPIRGCRRVSPGCENCYAERQAHRFRQLGSNVYDWPTQTERVALNLQHSKGGNMAEWPEELRSRQFPHQLREAQP